MTVEKAAPPPLNHSPLSAKLDGLEGVEMVKLDQAAQRRLGCVVNEHVFLECPFAYVPRLELLELARGQDSGLEHLLQKIHDCTLEWVLMGYASKRIKEEPAPFVLCLNEESSRAFVAHNRSVSKHLLAIVRDEILKGPRPWQELGSSVELEDSFLRCRRPAFELDASLPVSELLRRRRRGLVDRGPQDARDSYVELVPGSHESFANINVATYARESQTTLTSQDAQAQTYPGNPKNQWTQYEFEIPQEFLDVWAYEEEEETVAESDRENDKGSSTESKEEKEKTEEELQLEENRRKEWEKLNDFLRNSVGDMIDAVSFNASTNLYLNDVGNLGKGRATVFVESCKGYEERVSLIDLKTIKDRNLFSLSWHCDVEGTVACAYLDENAKGHSLIALWSLISPLRPMIVLKCEEKISTISFCPLKGYYDVIVSGCLNGKVEVWEINRHWLTDKDENLDDSILDNDLYREPVVKEAKIATSAEKAQTASISSIQWLPPWCRLETDGNFQKVSSSSAKDQKAYFATSSTNGSIFFWSLPRCLTSPAKVRSPLHLTISPVYQLFVEEPGEKVNQRITLTCFCLPLAKSEESSSLSIRDNSDLERLRRLFVGSASGEVLCCTWEGQTFSVEVTDQEICKIQTKCCAHDGVVRSMVKSPYLDDVFMTVGGRIFAIWKEDLPETPVFRRRSKESTYGEGCWSGRSGMFLLARLDGCFEVWDLKRKSDEPVLLQTVSAKVTPYVSPSPTNFADKLLAVLDGQSTLRVYSEPAEAIRDEDLERCEWLEEFVWRETRRKHDFKRWQDEYLAKHPQALRRRQEREQAEAARRHREARERFLKEQETQARLEAERKLARRRRSKSEIWRENEQLRAETIILQKKGFIPAELERKRHPLVELEEQRKARAQRTKEELARADEILAESLTRLVPEARRLKQDEVDEKEEAKEKEEEEALRETSAEDYERIREELMEKLKRQPYEPSFDWREAMETGKRKLRSTGKRRVVPD